MMQNAKDEFLSNGAKRARMTMMRDALDEFLSNGAKRARNS